MRLITSEIIQRHVFICQITAPISGRQNFLSKNILLIKDNDMNVCLDKVVDRLSSQITRHKKKIQKNYKQNREILFDAVPETEEEEIAMTPVKSKSFDLSPMDADEAILQMELLNHSFFVFMNSATNRVAVVYKRQDEAYGILEPRY